MSKTMKAVEAFVGHCKKDITYCEQDLKYWRKRVNNHRGNLKVVRECQEIIDMLLTERKETEWKLRHWLNIGERLSIFAKKGQNKENQSLRQD